MRLGLWTLAWFGWGESQAWRVQIYDLPKWTDEQQTIFVVIWLIVGFGFLIRDLVG